MGLLPRPSPMPAALFDTCFRSFVAPSCPLRARLHRHSFTPKLPVSPNNFSFHPHGFFSHPTRFPSRHLSVVSATLHPRHDDDVYDVVVVGGGHAGCEASRMGAKTLLLTLNLDRIAWQPCNPAVGGPAKSQLLHEVDAMGGEIGKMADRTENLHLREATVTEILVGKNDNIEENQWLQAELENLHHRVLAEHLQNLGFETERLKTGTPARVGLRSVNVSQLEKQPDDEEVRWFSFDANVHNEREQMCCYLTHSTAATHQLIKDNLHETPTYGGWVEAKGPRYCPSIEDKIVRFKDKDSHQIFLEPEGRTIPDLYVQA